MTQIINVNLLKIEEERFQLDDYLTINELIFDAIDRLDKPSMIRLQSIRRVIYSQLYGQGLGDLLDKAVEKQRMERKITRGF